MKFPATESVLRLGWLAVALAVAPTGAQDDKLYLPATETAKLKAKEGQRVVVHGRTAGSGKSTSGTNFVHFEDAEFSLVTFKSDLARFPEGEPADLYEGKRLAVEGVISIYQDKPQIKLVDPGQVMILEADAVFPPKPEAKPSPPKAATEPEKSEMPTAPPTEAKRKPPVDPSEYFKKKE